MGSLWVPEAAEESARRHFSTSIPGSADRLPEFVAGTPQIEPGRATNVAHGKLLNPHFGARHAAVRRIVAVVAEDEDMPGYHLLLGHIVFHGRSRIVDEMIAVLP